MLDIPVQERRTQEAAEAFLRRVVGEYQDEPRVIVTDKLASYGPAIRAVLPRTEHRTHKELNNVAEVSRQPTRQRERAMRPYKSPAQAQRFLALLGPIREHFCPGRHRPLGSAYRTILATRFAIWRDVTGVAT